MSRTLSLAILSDVHYASAAEQARGEHYELVGVSDPVKRSMLRLMRHYIWLRHPLRRNYLLDKFISQAGPTDYVIANGDYSCDTAFVGVSDDAAFQSAGECLGRLRLAYSGRFHATIGDHELGKFSFVGSRGGLRLASFHRMRDLALEPFWRLELGRYVLIGVTSSLIALPLFDVDMLPDERLDWERLREAHLAEVRATFAGLKSDKRVMLFCHDPSALPFLGREDAVHGKLSQIEHTIIGHLHSPFVFMKSSVFAGIPRITFLGHTARRMTASLRQARHWKPFRPRLCPSLSGIELLKDGGFLTVELDADAGRPARLKRHRLPR